VDEVSPRFGYYLQSERDSREKFLAIEANPFWWPITFNPKYFKPMNVPRTIEVSFVGGNYALRGRYVVHLLENGIDVQAYGPAWRWGARTRWRSWVKRYLLLLKSIVTRFPQNQGSVSGALADHDFARSQMARFPNNLHHPVSDKELTALYSRSLPWPTSELAT